MSISNFSGCEPVVVVETSSGARVLPHSRKRTRVVNSYDAHLGCDADLRTRSVAHAERASLFSLIANPGNGVAGRGRVLGWGVRAYK